MRALDRKLLRELRQSKGQALAIGLVVASGVAVFVMALGTLSFLQSTRDAYYDRYRLADLFASLNLAPQHVGRQVESLPGVATVQTRIVSEVTLDVPGLAEPAVGRLVSIPNSGSAKLNALYLQSGRLPDPDRAGEVLASDAFVEANRLSVGDSVSAVLNGRMQTLRIVGVALSPEYVFQVRGGDLLPDQKRFGVFWMPRRQMEAAFDMDGAFNNLTVRLLRGASQDEVIARLDNILEPYGGVGAIGREDQVSARFLADEIKQLRATAFVSPMIFLAVAAFLLNVVLSRRIATQRGIIAILKAFGYANSEIAWHYLKTSILLALLGGVLGAVAGMWMGSGLAELYSEFYRFPTFVYRPDWRVVLFSMGISLSAAVLGSYRAVLAAVRLPPAEAMRPAAPKAFHATFMETLGLSRWLPVAARMTLRSLARRPVNALLSSLGIACSVAVLVLSGFGSDAIEHLIEFQFVRAQRQEMQVSFYQVTSPQARYDLAHLPGVQLVEPFRAVPVKMQHRHHVYRTSILGLEEDRDLFLLLDTDASPIRVPSSGVVLSDKLAETLDIQPGETLTVEVLEGEQPVRSLLVAGVATEYSGMGAYMQRHSLNRMMRETDAISGAYLAVDSSQQDELYQQLKQTPRVASVTVKSATVDQFRETIAKNQLTMQSFTIFFAAVIAVGVVYNTSRISLDERSRELATLRVIGFTRGEVSAMLLGELAILTILAIPIGWAIGYGFSYAMVRGFESELYRIPLVIRPASYARAALVTAVASAISGLIVRRRLDELDLVEVLKSQE
ncbi:MAG: FtsX-like permease family protein [Candidatus Paceibacterota bacterium]